MAGDAIRRIGVLTGGGDCPGLNAVIRGVTKPAQDYGMTVYGIALVGESSMIVTGPSLVRETLIFAPNSPVATVTPSSSSRLQKSS